MLGLAANDDLVATVWRQGLPQGRAGGQSAARLIGIGDERPVPSRTEPASGASSPSRIFTRVVLPAPLADDGQPVAAQDAGRKGLQQHRSPKLLATPLTSQTSFPDASPASMAMAMVG